MDSLDIGFAEGHATTIVSMVHEHIATEADAEVGAATMHLHQANVELDVELLAPRWWQWWWWWWQW
jgi:hypothetical protein